MTNEIAQLVVRETTPKHQLVHIKGRVTKETILALAAKKGTAGITYQDLIHEGPVTTKKQAQDRLKRFAKMGVLCKVGRTNLQHYYDPSIRSDVIKAKYAKITPISHTGVSALNDPITHQSLEGFVLPLLPTAPFYIHKMNFTTKYNPIHYDMIDAKPISGNKGKRFSYPIRYNERWHGIETICYPNGVMNIYTTSSNAPLKLENESDRVNLLGFVGAVHALISSKFISEIAPISEWQLSQCDINKDIPVSDQFHYNGINVQIKHLDRLFSIYIKSMGAKTVCRVEQQRMPQQPIIQTINEILNPTQRLEQQVVALQARFALSCSSWTVNN